MGDTDEPAGTKEAADAEQDDAPAENAHPSRAGAVKAWADALSAVLKATFLMVGAAVIVWIAAAVMLHEHQRRSIAVELAPDAERLLHARGVEVDLASAFIADLNADILNIESFIRVSLFRQLLLGGPKEDVSLKAFGVDTSTDQLSRLYRLLFGAPEPYRFHIDLLEPTGRDQEMTLLIDARIDGPGRSLSFRVPSNDPRLLRRGIDRALQSASETLLQEIDPLLAALLFLNMPGASIYPDELQRYGGQAAAAALSVRARNAADPELSDRDAEARGCMADVVFHGALLWVTLDAAGMPDVEAVARRRDADATCRYSARTSAAFWRLSFGICLDDPASRKPLVDEARRDVEAQEGDAGSADAQERGQIVERTLAVRIRLAVEATLDPDRRRILCGLPPSAGWDRRLADFDLAPFEAAAAEIGAKVPTGRRLAETEGLIGSATQVIQAIPRGALRQRDRWTEILVPMIDAYLPDVSQPRYLMTDRAAALQERASVRMDAARLSQKDFAALSASGFAGGAAQNEMLAQARSFLNLARADYLRASALPEGLAINGPAALEPLRKAGDMSAAMGDRPAAFASYSRAVTGFVEREEPPREAAALGAVASHWLAAMMAGHSCSAAAPLTDAAWDRAWAPLGLPPGQNLCDIALQAGAPPAGGATTARDDASLIALLAPAFIVQPLSTCLGLDPKRPDDRPDMLRRFDELRCIDGVTTEQTYVFTREHTSDGVDDAVRRAIARR